LAAACVAAVGVAVGTAMSVWLQGRVARVDSATVFAGTVFWSVLWGGWGLMLGPLLVVVMRLAWLRAPALAERHGPPDAVLSGTTDQAPCGEFLQADGTK
jgi:predicted PurR-regulated permease PerM